MLTTWKYTLYGLILALIAVGIITPAQADGIFIPPRNIPNFAIKYHRVNVDINQQVAITTVDQAFRSMSNQQLEATYIFPIPDGASMSKFSMDVDGKMTPAQLLQADEARRIYEEIVRQRIDPGLLEYMGQNLFKARIFPILPYGEKQVKLRYEEVLKQSHQMHEYRYTLSTEKFSAKPLENVVITVKLKTLQPLKNIYSPTHDVSIRKLDDHTAQVSYEAKNIKPDTDFRLYYTTSPDPVGVTVLSYKEAGENGYFMLLASPKVEWEKQKSLPKNVTFVLDTSGSMAGEKFQQAQAALNFCLKQLQPQDRFQLISFSDMAEPLFKQSEPATPVNVQKALKRVKDLEATGGTNIDESLLMALKNHRSSQDVNMIVFLTDGDPTVGETVPEKILDHLRASNQSKTRIFVFGVGFDVNIHFLDKMSLQNKGSSEYVRPEENIEAKVSHLYTSISHPILTDLQLDYGAVEALEIMPTTLPDFFKGSQLVVTGRYRKAGNTTIQLRGKVQQENRIYPFPNQTFSSQETQFDFLPRIWASRKIGFLLDQIRLKGQNKELIAEVVRLSKKYGIITEYTSFLVREDVAVTGGAPGNDDRLMAEAREELDKKVTKEHGSSAISQSRNLQTQQAQAAAPSNRYYDEAGQEQTVTQVRYIAQRAFYQKKGVWQDVNLVDKMSRIAVQQFGQTYFALARQPQVREILALGGQVEFVWQGNVVVIGSTGADDLTPELKGKLKL